MGYAYDAGGRVRRLFFLFPHAFLLLFPLLRCSFHLPLATIHSPLSFRNPDTTNLYVLIVLSIARIINAMFVSEIVFPKLHPTIIIREKRSIFSPFLASSFNNLLALPLTLLECSAVRGYL